MFAVCTRAKNDDYKFHGATMACENFKKELEPINFLMDTTKPLVVFKDNALFVTGIASGRVDRVRTPVRYSFFYQGDKARSLFPRLQTALMQNKALPLGQAFDRLLKIGKEDEQANFTLPAEDDFIRVAEADLPPTEVHGVSTFALWTTFCPSERTPEAFQSFLHARLSHLPEKGTIEVANLPKLDLALLAQKKTPACKTKNIGTHLLVGILGITFGIGLGIWLTGFLKFYGKPLEAARTAASQKGNPSILHAESVPQRIAILVMEKDSAKDFPSRISRNDLQTLQEGQPIWLTRQEMPQKNTAPVLLIPLILTPSPSTEISSPKQAMLLQVVPLLKTDQANVDTIFPPKWPSMHNRHEETGVSKTAPLGTESPKIPRRTSKDQRENRTGQ